MQSSISRRTLLAAGAALAVGAACGSDSSKKATGPTSTTSAPSAAGPDDLEVLVGSPQLVAGTDQRLVAGILADAEPLREAEGVRFAFGRDFDHLGPFQPATFHHEGIEERPYYRTAFRFDRPGPWVLAVIAGKRKGATQVEVIAPSDTRVPLAGQKLISIPTPTVSDHRGVDPICTAKPPCPFHDISLDAATTAGRPVAVIFSTPALCQSRVCGPVLEILVKQAPAFADKVRFVHVEVYKSLQVDFSSPDALSPGMQAYHLQFEPIMFLAGADGVIRERLDGPYDAIECRDALQRLVTA